MSKLVSGGAARNFRVTGHGFFAEASSAPSTSLASEQGRKEVKKLKRELTKSPEAATTFLKEIGILTHGGHLAKRYGGR